MYGQGFDVDDVPDASNSDGGSAAGRIMRKGVSRCP